MGTTTVDVKEEAAKPEDLEGGSADEIRARIEHTREEMAHTIDVIQERLNPENLKAMAAEKIQDLTVGTAKRAAQKVVDTVAELTPQPRHNNPNYPFGDKNEARQQCVDKAKSLFRKNQKYLAAGATGLVVLGVAAKFLAGRRFTY